MFLLKDIASIQTGHIFREGIKLEANGRYQVIQISSITIDAQLNEASLLRVNLSDVKPQSLIRQGDVLFTSRGARRQAVAITRPLPDTVSVAQIFMLRDFQGVLPEFVAWYINQKPAQRYLNEHTSGTNITLVNKESLGMMPVPAPPMEVQQKIVAVCRLSQQEKELVTEIQAKRHLLTETILLNCIAEGDLS